MAVVVGAAEGAGAEGGGMAGVMRASVDVGIDVSRCPGVAKRASSGSTFMRFAPGMSASRLAGRFVEDVRLAGASSAARRDCVSASVAGDWCAGCSTATSWMMLLSELSAAKRAASDMIARLRGSEVDG